MYIYRHISKASFCNGINLLDKLLIFRKTIGTNEHFSRTGVENGLWDILFEFEGKSNENILRY